MDQNVREAHQQFKISRDQFWIEHLNHKLEEPLVIRRRKQAEKF